MEIIEDKEKFSLKITFLKNRFLEESRYITTKGKSDEEIFNEKIKLIDDLCNTNYRFWFAQKSIIKAYTKIDPRFEEIYKQRYSDEIYYYSYSLKKDEKEFVDKCINFYRGQNSD